MRVLKFKTDYKEKPESFNPQGYEVKEALLCVGLGLVKLKELGIPKEYIVKMVKEGLEVL